MSLVTGDTAAADDISAALPAGLGDTPVAPRRTQGKFTQGSILRHTVVMTATGAVGTLSIFVVDLLSLLYVSWLGRTELKAAVGFATQVSMFPVAVNIGLSIAVTAAVSRALVLGIGPWRGASRPPGSRMFSWPAPS